MPKALSTLMTFMVVTWLTFGPLPARADDLRATLAAEIEQMEAQIKLTPEQHAKAHPILMGGLDQRMALLDEYGITAGKRPGMMQAMSLRSKMGDIDSAIRAQLAPIFTPQQAQRFDQLGEASRARMKAVILGQ